jgi:hypothetical protein
VADTSDDTSDRVHPSGSQGPRPAPSNDPGLAATPSRLVQVHLEELGQHSWVKALANTVGGLSGSAQFRFVARGEGADERSSHLVEGATFPVMRWADLNDLTEPNTWLDTARERLGELDAELVSRGLRRRSDRGPHWWSLRYDIPGDPSEAGAHG